MKCSFEYKKLRAYIKEVANINAGVIDGYVADAISRDEKTIQSITAGNRIFSWGEAKESAKYFIDTYKAKPECDQIIFRRLLRNFLMAFANADKKSGADEELVDRFLNENFGADSLSVSQHTENASPHVYSNLSHSRGTYTLIKTDIYDAIEDGITQGKIVFIDGFTGTGKSYIASYYAKKCADDYSDLYSAVIWNEDKDGNLTLNTVISNILSTFEYDNVGNMNTNEKIAAAMRQLKEHRAILIVDNFESVQGGEKEAILEFLLDKVSTDTAIIITCKNRMNSYARIQQHPERFHEVKLENLTEKEWTILSSELETSFTDVRDAVKAVPELKAFVFTLCEGNPYAMAHVLTSISTKIVAGTSFRKISEGYHISDIDRTSHDWIVKKSVNELSDNERRLLVSLCLFAVPATPREISGLSGLNGIDDEGDLIEGTPLDTSIKNCHTQSLVAMVLPETVKRFSLTPLLRPVMRGELKKDNYSQYADIISNWINHFIEFSATIGFCFDDFSRLEQLDGDVSAKQAENLMSVLDFCYRTKKWREYYQISENVKYYFYTRGVSGIGQQSVHYKRAYAAKMMGNNVDEFNSLLYHCNVSCKAKEWEGIDECFARIEDLKNTVCGISEVDMLKLTYIQALYHFSYGSFSKANSKFEKYGVGIKDFRKKSPSKQIEHDYIAYLRWHSDCLYRLAVEDKSHSDEYVAKAIKMLDNAIECAKPINFERAVVHSLLSKAKIMMNIKHDIDAAKAMLVSLSNYISVINNDVVYNTEYTQLEMQLK
jgi:hypothetical protein